jgi:hypothetical protein
MRTKRYLVSATVLLASLLLWGCSKKPEQTASTLSADNQDSATQPGSVGATPRVAETWKFRYENVELGENAFCYQKTRRRPLL